MPAAALAFSPLGLTVSFTAANTVPTSAQAKSSAPTTRPAYQYRIINAGQELVLLGVGVDDTAAKAAAASIAAGAVPLVPGAVEVLGFPAGSFFTGKTASGTSVVYVTPGEGL
jgi:hypothetical protein